MKKQIHIISHSHWDREWYMPFEYHRAYLVKLIDDCLELFEKDKDFRHFHLDGQTIVLEDYLEIKPQNKELLKKYVKTGKFAVGPWYVLQDEFLTSSEANIRNLLVGMDIAKEYGAVCPVGYFPDSFGNAGQMPQILKQAGMRGIAFGRGVKPTGVNNEVYEGNDYSSKYSEMYWQSPDGSKLPAILFAGWYNNGMEIPADAGDEYWQGRFGQVEAYACTKHLLLMNGCDHQPVQKNLSTALKNAREKYPDYDFVHSDFETYIDSVVGELTSDVNTIKGELISQNTNGWGTLVNTCSSHVDLKVMNSECEILLECIAEPLSVIATMLGKEYPHDMLLYCWKTLMQNHPHDSICGCSCDEVNDEMRTRFNKCRQATEMVVKECLEYIALCKSAAKFKGYDAAFSIVNTYSHKRDGVASVDVDVDRKYGFYGTKNVADNIAENAYKGAYELVDEDGNIVPCKVYNLRAQFGYDLPSDKFRQPYMTTRVTVEFEVKDIAPFGCKTYGLRKCENKVQKTSLVTSANVMENAYIRAQINSNGTVDIIDKVTGREFKNTLYYEDLGDIGCEYTFTPAKDDKPILSSNSIADVELICDEDYKAEYKITTVMTVPASADETFENEKKNMVRKPNRCAKRSNQTVDLKIVTFVSLEKSGKALRVKTEFVNNAKDHRLRVVVPTGMNTTSHKAESVFELAKRNNVHNECWTYPSGCEHQQGFVMISDEKSGMAVANKGLYEYEILADNSIAVTLVRAVSELGDWGVFPTNLSQQQKSLSLEYEIVPYNNENDAIEELAKFRYPLLSVQNFDVGSDLYKNNMIQWSGNMLRLTSLKLAQNSNDIIARFVNYSDSEQTLTISKTDWLDNLYMSNVIEHKGEALTACDDKWTIKVKPFEIVTTGCSK